MTDSAAQALLAYFSYEHLPPDSPLRFTSHLCHDFADLIVSEVPDGPERTAGLRKLLEAKDCFVRASLPK